MSVKADPKQQLQKLDVEASCLENELMTIKSARTQASEAVLQFKRQLQTACLEVEKKNDSQRDRIQFLQRALETSEKEKDRLLSRLKQIDNEIGTQKEKYDSQVEALQYQAYEVETNLKSKIQVALHQLRGLREFQEHKHQMDQQMRTVSHILAKEKKERIAEQSLIHKALQSQREHYENQLNNDLNEANGFATKFEDLHLDKATTKILHEAEAKREELQRENSLTAEVLKKNDQLRHQLLDLEQQKKILNDLEKTLTLQSVDLKAKLGEVTNKYNDSLEATKEQINQLRNNMKERTAELTNHLENLKQENANVKRQLALSQKNLEKAQNLKEEKLRKQQELLGVMNEAAIFILTSLELQEQEPTKETIVKNSNSLNAVIRKLANVAQDMTGVESRSADSSNKNDSSAQTDKKMSNRFDFMKKGTNDFKNNTEYQKVYGNKDVTKFLRVQRNK